MSESENNVKIIYSEQQEEKLKKHIQKHFGDSRSILKEVNSTDFSLDVHIIAPNERYEGYTLLTLGAGAFKMEIPDEYEHPINSRRAEFLIRLPDTWGFDGEIDDENEADEKVFWPVKWLKNIAFRPILFETWLGWGHTVQSEEGPFAENTDFCCLLAEMPYAFGSEAFRADIGAEEPVHFYQLIPLYREEMDYKIQNGTEALKKLFDEDFSDIVNINRKNYCE